MLKTLSKSLNLRSPCRMAMDSSSSSSSSSSDKLQRLSLLAMGIPKRELMQEMSAHKLVPVPPEPVPPVRKPSNHERNIDGVATGADTQGSNGIFPSLHHHDLPRAHFALISCNSTTAQSTHVIQPIRS